MLRGEEIEPHLKEQLFKDMAAALKLPGISQPTPELAAALYEASAAAGVSDATTGEYGSGN